MDESSLEIFVDGAIRYFDRVSEEPARVDTPYLIKNEEGVAFDYTGAINISGSSKGRVYFTAPNVLLRHLLMSLGEDDVSDDNMADLVGEIANTISGNARKKLGGKFIISTPYVLSLIHI